MDGIPPHLAEAMTDAPRIGQKVRFLTQGKLDVWRIGTVSMVWTYDNEICVDVKEGGTFFPTFGDQWELCG